MTDIAALSLKGRDRAGKGAARATRREGLIPGVIYGGRKAPVLIAIDPRVVMGEMRRPGFSTRVYDMEVDGTSAGRAMVHDVQFHPVTDNPIHIDFLRVDKNTEVTAAVPVHFLNEEKSPGLKRGGVLNVVRHDIELVGRPDDLPPAIEVDLTGLEIGDSVHSDAITIPASARFAISDRDFTICTIAAPSVMPAQDEAAAESEEVKDED